MLKTLPARWRHLDAALILPVCVTGLLILSVVLEVLYLLIQEGAVVPGLHRGAHFLLAGFLLLNAVGNIIMFIYSSSSIKGVFLPASLVAQGWEYCYTCQTHVPPRCQHCFTCGVCVLRRDHHCVLLGQCVGFRNQRYFICTLLYGWAGLLYATILNAEIFLGILHEGLSFHSAFLLIMPWMMLLTGQVSGSAFIFAFVADTCVVGFLLCTAFLLFHSVLLFRGATSREWFAGDRRYDLGCWRRNAQEALGSQWYLVWFCPLLSSPLPGDGVRFEMRAPQGCPLPKTSDL
ncbi:probable palmitoyltransferase ZDHHC24 [Rhinatrema bivittatum]|uniref:probable palmitoyltransferase ZDHHC24 n=1 Tax=Rhinatrema bivittatum TaxID=194408 RepID=UPI001129312F|nr:probable palmitoyltransferase ZDHHC24 [Rhinatrema bivittatum]XP_029467977.1 probable palmitoyltransferase ZDHHC24 [Rhinatrema bivittatum]XP_029467978.1 probable palmitoyltransferase ZDHHC24 [Rhinatrema bivittatum]